LASEDVVKECCYEKKKKKTEWNTQGGPFKTTHRATVTKMVLPQFTKNRKVDFRMHLFKKTRGDKYDFIFGCDFLQGVGIDVINSRRMLAWDNIEVEMLNRNELKENNTEELRQICSEKERVMIIEPTPKIRDAQYKNPNLKEVAEENFELTGLQKKAFPKTLEKNEAAFQGKCGTWIGEPVERDYSRCVCTQYRMPVMAPRKERYKD